MMATKYCEKNGRGEECTGKCGCGGYKETTPNGKPEGYDGSSSQLKDELEQRLLKERRSMAKHYAEMLRYRQ